MHFFRCVSGPILYNPLKLDKPPHSRGNFGSTNVFGKREDYSDFDTKEDYTLCVQDAGFC